jgi:TonB family protein
MRKIIVIAAAALPLHVDAQPPPPPAPRIVAPAQPRGDPQALISGRDYPDSALRAGEQGTVRYLLEVGADGRVHGCTVTRSSGSFGLDSATCRIMKARSRFTPARDSNGNPAPSQEAQAVAWSLPAEAKVVHWGYGMVSHSVSPPAVAVRAGPPIVNPPSVAIPQDGPGEADLSLWDARTGALADLGRYESIPACRKVKAQLRLRPDQRAWCTVAPDLSGGRAPR